MSYSHEETITTGNGVNHGDAGCVLLGESDLKRGFLALHCFCFADLLNLLDSKVS
jgi:hypothetical protein